MTALYAPAQAPSYISGIDGINYPVINGVVSVPQNNVLALLASGFSLVSANDTPDVMEAATYGVTGINDGTRDDAPLLAIAYSAAVAAGSKSLVLPVGNVYVNARIPDASYPFDYVVRILVDDFTIVVPPGCLIHDLNVGGGTAGTYLDIFQVGGGNATAVKRSGVLGGGKFIHATPGAGNNFSSAVHLTSTSDQCFIDNLSADGLASQGDGVFDNSSANRASMSRLSVKNCVQGVMQSSTSATVKATISDITVLDYKGTGSVPGTGLAIYGYDVTLSGKIITDNTSNTASTVACHAIDINSASLLGILNAGGATIRCIGPGPVGHTQLGIFINGNSLTGTAPLVFGDVALTAFDNPVLLSGVTKDVHSESLTIENATFAVERVSSNAACTGDLSINNLDISNVYQGLYAGSNAQTGKVILGKTKIALFSGSGGTTIDANTNTIIPLGPVKRVDYAGGGSPINSTAIPIANRGDYQRSVASSGTVTATAGIAGLTLLLTAAATALTVVFPTSPVDGQSFRLRSINVVTTLTVTGTVAGSPAALTAGYDRTFVYDSTAATWI